MNNLVNSGVYKINFRREWFFILGITISFNIMLTNYLYEFDSGLVKGGDLIRFILKALSIFFIIISQPKPSKFLIQKNFLIIFSFILFLISALIYTPFSDWNEFQFYNMFFVLFILFGIGYKKKFIQNLNIILIYIFLFIWLPFDLISLISGNSLWENKAFIGGIGNPSSYGLILLYLILINKNIFSFFFESLINILLFVSLLLTQALMPILILLIFSFFIFKKKVFILISVLITTIGVFFLDLFLNYLGLQDLHFLAKIEGLYNYGLYADLGSVFYRLEYWKDVYKLFDNPLTFLFGHINGFSYNAGDGQYVAYLTSFGFPIFIIFIFSIFKIVYYFKNYNNETAYRFKLFFIAVLLILLTNRYLDYWPNAIIVFLTINHLSFLNHEYWNNKSISI
tara:strand:- start:889 stop:2079 length:1191 start_codon:yes stop_codon:yes gene_type:complete